MSGCITRRFAECSGGRLVFDKRWQLIL